MADLQIPKDPSNNDIMLILVQMNATLESVKLQAEKTNGRVTKTEEFINAWKAVEVYKKETPAQPQQINAPNATTVQVMTPSKWFQSEKLVAGVVAVLLAVAAFISYFVGRGDL